MRLLFVADGRSPIALNWISYFLDRGDEVHLITTFDCPTNEPFASINFVPVAFSQAKKRVNPELSRTQQEGLFWGSSLVNFRTSMRRIIFPLSMPTAVRQLRKLITDIQPDLVHALRIPFEGILAAQALQNYKKILKSYTRQALFRTDGLHTDCHRDLRLAYRWGYSDSYPTLVIPGNGGIRTEEFYPPEEKYDSQSNMVINPRGVRSYIRNDTFFAAIPQILAQHPKTTFTCPGMMNEFEVQKWIEKFEINAAVQLLPNLTRKEMAEMFRSAEVAVSPSTHDGTPNTLLEAMACGCYPIAGDLESIREWIEPGLNGTLFDPTDPVALADAVIDALEDPEIRQKAAENNQVLISERAEYKSSMARAFEFYKSVIENKK
jgi:glycosyltransferase involved in cell wall biosynthesis